jgi:UPF0716 protein FxsA
MLALALLGAPLAEVAAFVAVVLTAGWLVAVALLLGTSVLGVLVLRVESRAALGRVTAAVSQQQPPGPSAVDTALGLLGGVLLVIRGSSPTRWRCRSCCRRPGASCAGSCRATSPAV